MSVILSIVSAAIEIYTLICFVYIFMSWFPGARFTKFGQVICSLCEPYMGLFSKWRWTRIGNIDFSPIISIGLLTLASSVIGGIQATGRIWFGGILFNIVRMLWSLISTLLTIFTILILVRWIVLLVNHGQTKYNSAWNSIDRMISNITYKISGMFIRKSHNYQTSLLATWIFLIVISILGRTIVTLLLNIIYRIPF